jgi:hypothetical protein
MKRQSLGICVLATAALLSTSCSKDPEYTGEERACISRHYTNYDSTKIDQCVAICKVCMKGSTITCNTSCRLRGAS